MRTMAGIISPGRVRLAIPGSSGLLRHRGAKRTRAFYIGRPYNTGVQRVGLAKG
jgi:hypothetical protein